MTINNALKYGFSRALFTVIGNSLGLAFLALLFSIGVSEFLAKYPILINFIKIIGATYIGYLALKTIGAISSSKKKKVLTHNENLSENKFSLIKEGFFLAATNPKPILFFGAVFPQFLVKNIDLKSQFLILSCIFIVTSASILLTYALITKLAKTKLDSGSTKNKINKFFGLLLLIMSLMLAYSAIRDL